MADLFFLLLTAAFFALSVGYVKLCDKIIGPDATQASGSERDLERDGVKA